MDTFEIPDDKWVIVSESNQKRDAEDFVSRFKRISKGYVMNKIKIEFKDRKSNLCNCR